jgi:hypothetical protein
MWELISLLESISIIRISIELESNIKLPNSIMSWCLFPFTNIISLLIVAGASVAPNTPWLAPPRNVTFKSLDSNPVLKIRPMPQDPQQRLWTITDNDFCGSNHEGSDPCGKNATPKRLKHQESVIHANKVYGGVFSDPIQGWGPWISEWGYELQHFYPNSRYGVPDAYLCRSFEVASYKKAPKSRAEAFERMRLYWACRIKVTNETAGNNFNGYYYFNHLAAQQNNSLSFFSEVGADTGSVNIHMAHSRGASRMYGKPWGMDMSPWYYGTVKEYPGGTGGHSLSMFRRVYFTTYMSGASQLNGEGGSRNWFLTEINKTSGAKALSPLGFVGLEISDFAKKHPERGFTYTPVGIVMQNGHGFGTLGWVNGGRAWDVFPLTEGEKLVSYVWEAIWPSSFRVHDEVGLNVGSPYGEIFDMLVSVNLTDAVLSSYRVLWLVGDVEIDKENAALLEAFVSKGGVVIVTASQVQNSSTPRMNELVGATFSGPLVKVSASGFRDLQTNEQSNMSSTHSGHVVSTQLGSAVPLLQLNDAKMTSAAIIHKTPSGGAFVTLLITSTFLARLDIQKHLLQRISDDVLPWSITPVKGPLPQMILNRHRQGWNVTLVNNHGVTKPAGHPTVVNKSMASTVKLHLKQQGSITNARALISNTKLPVLPDGSIRVNIGVGGVEVVGIETNEGQ